MFLCVSPMKAMEDIRPPFGFQWGETSSRMEQALQKVQAKVVEKDTIPGGSRWKVIGISQRLLLVAYFIFQGDTLHEIELNYGDPAWSIAQYTNFFDQTRRYIDQRYGSGGLIAKSTATQNGVTHTLTGYQWTQPGATLQIFLFTAEKAGETSKVLSLHYRSS